MKRLYRNKTNGKGTIKGVCAGLADYFEIDVTIIRVIFVLGTFFTIFPFILTYLIMWIVVPEKNNLVN